MDHLTAPARLDQLPPLATPRLRLRPLGPDDAQAFRDMTDEPAITDAVHFLKRPFTLADAGALIRGEGDGRDCFWGVWLEGEARLLGTVGTHLRDEDGIEIGYWFASAAQGRGLATEAVGAVVAAVAAAFSQRRVYAECRPENAASWRLLERIGFASDNAPGQRPGRMRLVLRRA